MLALAAPVAGTAGAASVAGPGFGLGFGLGFRGAPVRGGAVETVIHPSGWVLRSDDLIHLPTA
ncbi:hypothetical protein [Azospirillum thermophilum]|uniref:hypothetical protein n=1 Tax=Azospirillum thermophilum TaxID=2202148 RepID=UPI0011B41EE8|nr:hypothetical protein [Azospirillum thermophilum]